MRSEATDVKTELWREALSWAKTILFALIFAWFFTNFVIVNAHVPTGSMEATIPAPSRIIAFRLSYMFSEPQRGDIIVFRGEEQLLVKRVIGLPGETVSIYDWRVYIDGEQLEEGYTRSAFDTRPSVAPHRQFPLAEEYITIPDGHFFVLGDNRDYSHDSRSWADPFVPEGTILGRALFLYWPRIQIFSR
ncbi:MAG: signal peptidase I [Defluviitaleaceae bacterium]|nr:signal peptidase I [Defluviitaleaceae bacterium]